MRNLPMKKSPTRTSASQLASGVPGPLREAVGDEERGAAHHQQHAERDEEGGDFQPRDEPAVDEADQGGDDEGDEEGDLQRGRRRC